jgi:putative selenate reductase molybdopterin-binding subunit
MKIIIIVNAVQHPITITPSSTLFSVLRRLGFYSLKFGDEHGLSGADTVLLDGRPVNAGSILAAQVQGHNIVTIEGMGEHPDQGWKKTSGLHPLQLAFIENGAIQCGYCTPAQILAAKALLDKNPHPNEHDVREAIAGVLCRCTGYVKPVQAILHAAAVMRGESSSAIDRTTVHPVPETVSFQRVGKPDPKVDAIKLAQGKPAFTADMYLANMLYAKVLHSPHAHARIMNIDTTKARALPGVAAVLTWKDLPRVVYSTAGQSDPIPGPLDSFSLDNKVRFVGDRVAFVAAETIEIAEQALKLIDVEYELLTVLLDPSDAMKPGTVRIHDEPEYVNFADSKPEINLAARIRIDIGDLEKGFADAD